jgi:hypothetical protein
LGRAARWLALGAVAVAGAAAALHPVTVLELENAARGRTWRFALRGGEVFAVVSQHSMYDQPVTEEFSVDPRGRIALRAVSSPSAAVREYFGITGAGERQAMRRTMPEVVFRVAAGAPQRLLLGGAGHSFLEFGDHGDRLVMRAVRRPALAQVLSSHLASAP